MITSVSNQQIRHLLQLQKKARARKEEGVFIVEGIKMYQEAPREWIVKTYVSESFLKKAEYQHVLGQPDAEILSDEVSERSPIRRRPRESCALCGCRKILWSQCSHKKRRFFFWRRIYRIRAIWERLSGQERGQACLG